MKENEVLETYINENKEKKNNMTGTKALIIMIASAAAIFLGALVIKSPTVVNLIVAGLVAIFLSMIWGVKWDDIQNDILDLARRMFPAILVLIFVGMLIGVWIASGTVPILIYWGLELLTPRFFLVIACLTCSVMSLMTGTSWGTVGTIGIAFMGIAQGLGVPESYTAGAVLVGALFGDKLSPMSDTTVLAPAVSGTDVMSHVKYMLWTTVPSYTISLIFFFVVGLQFDHGSVETEEYAQILATIQSEFNLNPILILPPIVVLFMIFKQKPIIPSFAVGIVLGVIFAMIFQDYSLADVLTACNSGYARTTDIEVVDTMLCRG